MASLNDVKKDIATDEEPVVITILQKSGEPYLARDGKTPATMSLLGDDAKAVRQARERVQRRNLRATRDGGEVPPADYLKNRIEIATAAVVSWTGWDDETGQQDWPCAADNVGALLGLEHILEQAERAMRKHGAFFARPSAT